LGGIGVYREECFNLCVQLHVKTIYQRMNASSNARRTIKKSGC
jgi:hypothetical protein